MTAYEVEKALSTMRILVDTREQPTPQSRARYEAFGVPWRRQKLDFGDYSAEFEVEGKTVSLAGIIAVERKMGFGEIASNFCRERARFAAEFDRAKAAGGKIVLIVEGGNWEQAYRGKYRSQMSPASLIASLLTWEARYNSPVFICTQATTGRLIHDVLRYEGREFMLRQGEGETR